MKRFDEVICDKASKFSVDDLNDKLKNYITQDQLTRITDDYDAGREILTDLVDELKDHVSLKSNPVYFIYHFFIAKTKQK